AGFLCILGVGLGITMVPATNAIMSSLPLNRAGVGSAATDTAQEVGNALGVAVLGSILAAAYHTAMDASPIIQALPTSLRALARDSIGSAAALADQLGGQAGQTVLHVAQSSFVTSIGPTVLIGAAISCCGALVAFIFLPRRAKQETATILTEGDGVATMEIEEETPIA
ncbi:MAG TPA: hypothetical protein VFN35_32080, partial [Ktedonobacteraceae bacterium]|nr:hypothetical protein [Ktedonobacteraceae bacterium]